MGFGVSTLQQEPASSRNLKRREGGCSGSDCQMSSGRWSNSRYPDSDPLGERYRFFSNLDRAADPNGGDVGKISLVATMNLVPILDIIIVPKRPRWHKQSKHLVRTLYCNVVSHYTLL